MRIAVDAMGGDHAPHFIIEGAVRAAKTFSHEIILVGDPEAIHRELKRLNAEQLPIRIEASEGIVSMDDSPAQGCRQKPKSSIMVATKLVSLGQADAVVSAGNSGASMAAALWHLHRLPGVLRPSITTVLPTITGTCVLTDAGANVDCKPKNLLQFAIMGSHYAKTIFNIPNPRVGILSIGEEPSKGNELTLAAAELLRQNIPNFIGNVEGKDVPRGMADVVVCDGFVGNVVLKVGEGMIEVVISMIKQGILSDPIARLGGFFLRSALRGLHKKLDYAEYGGAPLLGVNGISIVCHGKSNPKAIFNAIRVAGELGEKQINEKIREELHRVHPVTEPPSSTAKPQTSYSQILA
jgi:glycerol-3-phosphate acyltransferase PlsX